VNRKYRKPIMVANWKMNKTPTETAAYIHQLWELIGELRRSTVVICPPAICVPSAVSAAKRTRVRIGAENCHTERYGAHTGEISAEMYQDAGCDYVVLESSVEDAAKVNGKLRAVLDAGMRPILCLKDDIRSQIAEPWTVAFMLGLILRDLPRDQIKNLIVAYAPSVSDDADLPSWVDARCGFIRTFLRKRYSARDAQLIPILYAGEPSEQSAQAFLSQKNIDGFLVYLAGLKPQSFAKLIAAVEAL